MPAFRPSLAIPPWLSKVIVYLGFAGTGVGMSLPGSVLPALLKHWDLNDSQAGFFFFVGWMGTSIGALFVRPSRTNSLALASLLTALGAFGLAFGTSLTIFVAMGIYGIGLGMAMTAISLLQSARNSQHRSVELNRLNLVWALGACLSPSLAAHSLRVASVRTIFSALGLCFALLLLWTLACERDSLPTNAPALSTPLTWRSLGIRQLRLWPLTLVLVIFLPTGMEASMGAWIAAYVQRAQQTVATTVTAGTFFWLGLMLSRTLSSFLLVRRLSERIVLYQSLATVVLGMALLLASQSPATVLPGVFLVGFGLGPVYPLLLAIALQYSENTAIFFIAGLGSAFLPWLTGIVSSSTSSLRLGLLVPLAASVLMLALGIRAFTLRIASPSASTPPHPQAPTP